MTNEEDPKRDKTNRAPLPESSEQNSMGKGEGAASSTHPEMRDSELKRFESDLGSPDGRNKKTALFVGIAALIGCALIYAVVKSGAPTGPVKISQVRECILDETIRGTSDCYSIMADYQRRKVPALKSTYMNAIQNSKDTIFSKCDTFAPGMKESYVIYKALVRVSKKKFAKIKIIESYPDGPEFVSCFKEKIRKFEFPDVEAEREKFVITDVIILSH